MSKSLHTYKNRNLQLLLTNILLFLTNCESIPPLFSENPEAILDSIGGDGVYKCDPCNFETKYSGNLKEHFKTQKHLSKTNSTTEEDPNFEFNESKVNIGEEIHRCEPCNFESKWIQSLQAHYKSSKHISNTDPSNEGICHDKSTGIEQGNFLRGIINWSGAARSVD